MSILLWYIIYTYIVLVFVFKIFRIPPTKPGSLHRHLEDFRSCYWCELDLHYEHTLCQQCLVPVSSTSLQPQVTCPWCSRASIRSHHSSSQSSTDSPSYDICTWRIWQNNTDASPSWLTCYRCHLSRKPPSSIEPLIHSMKREGYLAAVAFKLSLYSWTKTIPVFPTWTQTNKNITLQKWGVLTTTVLSQNDASPHSSVSIQHPSLRTKSTKHFSNTLPATTWKIRLMICWWTTSGSSLQPGINEPTQKVKR